MVEIPCISESVRKSKADWIDRLKINITLNLYYLVIYTKPKSKKLKALLPERP